MKSPNVKSNAVYKRSEFLDLLSSNNFYTVTAIALVLGAASAFGLIQNPRKLKTVVDVLSYKVSISHPDNQRMSYQVFQQERYDLSASMENYVNKKQSHFSRATEYLFDENLASEKANIAKKEFHRVAFSYDITSNKFWNDFNSSDIGLTKDTSKENFKFHPLSIQEERNAMLDQNDSKYSLANDLKRK